MPIRPTTAKRARQVLTEAGIVDALMYYRHPHRRQPAWQKCSDWRLVR
jgi:hypothetical protein